MTLKLIRLELAGTKDYPEGSANHGYEFVAPLDDDGHLDGGGWAEFRRACTVRRFRNGEDDEHGQLERTRDGNWVFSYAPRDQNDEPIFRFDAHVFAEGEYVSITENDGQTRPIRVVRVTIPLAPRG